MNFSSQFPFLSAKPLCFSLLSVPPSNITIVSSNTSLNLSWVPEERHRNHGFHIRYMRKTGKKRVEEKKVLYMMLIVTEREMEEMDTEREMEREDESINKYKILNTHLLIGL